MTTPHKTSRVCLFLLRFTSQFIFLHSKLALHSFESLFFENRSTFTLFSFERQNKFVENLVLRNVSLITHLGFINVRGMYWDKKKGKIWRQLLVVYLRI